MNSQDLQKRIELISNELQKANAAKDNIKIQLKNCKLNIQVLTGHLQEATYFMTEVTKSENLPQKQESAAVTDEAPELKGAIPFKKAGRKKRAANA